MADREWLDGLRRDAYRDLFEATWGHWDEARHRRHFAKTWEAGQISIIEVGGQRVGMLQLIESPESLEITEIQIRTEHQNRGLGTRVLSDVIETARERRMRISLYLGIKNARALKLYARLGFEEARRSDTHIFMEYRHG